jgi:hypothetical protein
MYNNSRKILRLFPENGSTEPKHVPLKKERRSIKDNILVYTECCVDGNYSYLNYTRNRMLNTHMGKKKKLPAILYKCENRTVTPRGIH